MPCVALLTDVASRAFDDDLPPLEAALTAAGATVTRAAWDDPATSFAGIDRVVVRSPWAYHEARDDYCRFVEQLASMVPVDNPPAVLWWNTDKRYLLELAAAGIAVTPTRFVAPGDQPALDQPALDQPALDQRDLGGAAELVVKPTVSAGSRNTARYRATDHQAIAAHVAALHAAGKTAMVQPYLRAVDDVGETAVVLLDGEISHALRKGPLLALGAGPVEGLFALEEMSPRTASAAQLAVVDAVRDFLARRFVGVLGGNPLLYARVDLVDDDRGRPLVLEVELNEPSLFHAHAPGSAERFAAAILRRC